MSDADTFNIIVKTLRIAAFWGIGEKNQEMLLGVAEQVEAADAESLLMTCPVCQETTCDDDCPLAGVRKELRDEARRQHERIAAGRYDEAEALRARIVGDEK